MSADAKQISGRIGIIDGFRCIAVLSVVCYHYYARHSPPIASENYLPYQFEPFTIVNYGYYGVQLFFVISGFVISHTLTKCESFGDFMSRRLIRLMPALITCSLISFFLIRWFYRNPPFADEESFLDFLPSLTFIPPDLWQQLLGKTDVGYIDGAYWSLSVEMMFYIVAGALFFFNRDKFLSGWLRVTGLLLFVRVLTSAKTHFIFPDAVHPLLDSIYHLYIILNFSYWVYFALGIFFYALFSGSLKLGVIDIGIMALLVLSEFYFLQDLMLKFLFGGVIGLFVVFIYKSRWLSFLEYRLFLWIGAISYPLYLIHQNIGLLLMNRISELLNAAALDRFMPLVAFSIVLLLADLIYRFIEKPAMVYLRNRFAIKAAGK